VNRDLATLLAVLLFAVLMAVMYFGSLDDDAPPPLAIATPAPTPKPKAVPTPRATPRPRPVATPRRAPPTPPPAAEDDEERVDVDTVLKGNVILEDGGEPGRCDVFVTVDGKRKKYWTKDDGSFRIEAKGGIVTLYGGRAFGSLHTRSEPVALDTREGGEWDVTLVIKGGETGGLGIGTKSHVRGIRVTSVFPGGPADGLGLKRNDVVIEVDGVPTLGWTTTQFIAEMTGQVGSSQNFRVRHEDGSEDSYEFERAIVQRPKPKLPGLE
jgi:hypothetical protein